MAAVIGLLGRGTALPSVFGPARHGPAQSAIVADRRTLLLGAEPDTEPRYGETRASPALRGSPALDPGWIS
jgi:hypothetical protein